MYSRGPQSSILGRPIGAFIMIEFLRTRLEHSSFAPILKSRTKREAMAELADLLVADGAVSADSRAAILTALLEREGKMSTGMQLGVAIPHAKTSAVKQLVTAVALSPEGIDFDSLDGQPSHIFVVTVSPPTDVATHIRFLADISRQLSSESVRGRLLACTSVEEMVAALCDAPVS